MKLTIKIIFILILIIVLVIIINLNNGYKRNSQEKFKNIGDYDYFQKLVDIKKSKITKKNKYVDKDDYKDLEVKIQSTNEIYYGLNNYLKKYEINFIYNLDKLDVNIPLVITYDNQSVRNDKNESFVNFLKGLNHYKYNFIVCGINTKWDGWYGRYKTYLELLEKIPHAQLIFITDSRDVLVNNSPQEFMDNYDKLIKIYNDETKTKIVFGTEVGCCVNQMWHYSPGTVFGNKNHKAINYIKEEVKNKINSETNVESERLKKSEIELTKSTYNLEHKYSLTRTDEIYPNGKKFPWEHWVEWNNLFIERFLEANIKYNLKISDYQKYPIIKLNFGLMVGICSSILKFYIHTIKNI